MVRKENANSYTHLTADGSMIRIKIKSSYGIKDDLKARGYKFDRVDGWDILLPIDLDRLISEHEALKALNVIDDLVDALTHFVRVGKFDMAQLAERQERVKAIIAIKPPRFYF